MIEEVEASVETPRQRELVITVIVPVYNAGYDLKRCLESLSVAGQQASDIILVDDASTDGAAEACAREYGTRYHRFDTGPNGPAKARNLGARLSPETDAYLFIDSDVSIAPETINQFRQVLTDSPDVAAVFGSYDEYPSARGWISQYKNLLHHYMHQIGNPEASTFWSGCGIVRRTVFETMNGFDEHFGAASIEDVELGLRMKDAGCRILLCRDIRACHHKNWTLKSWLATDIFARALPWSRLIIERDVGVPDTLNLGYRERVSAVFALGFFTSLALCLETLLRSGNTSSPLVFVFSALFCALVFAGLQCRLLVFFRQRLGWCFMLAAAFMHSIYYVYSSVVFVGVKLHVLARQFVAPVA